MSTVQPNELARHAVHYRQTAEMSSVEPGNGASAPVDVILDALGMQPRDVVLFWALSLFIFALGGVALGVVL